MTDQAKRRHLEMLQTALGPELIALLDDKKVIDIMLNPDGVIVVEKLLAGKHLSEIRLTEAQAENIIKLVASLKDEVTNSLNPMVASELPIHGARFQGVLPPVVQSPVFAIRKRASIIFTLDDYVKSGALLPTLKNKLQKAVLDRQNIMIAGGTGSGKTTFMNGLLNELKESSDRIIAIEDLPELQINVKDCVNLNTTPAVSMRDLVKTTLRMRPDRIMIGEVRDGAALDLLKAWNTGHPGGLCTIHANSAASTLNRLEDLIQEVVVNVPETLIGDAVDLVIFLQRDKSGKHVVQEVVEVLGRKKGQYELKSLL